MGTSNIESAVEILINPVFDYLLVLGATRTSFGYDASLLAYVSDLGVP